MNTHRDLIAWSKSIDFVLQVYSATSTFPAQEMYGLTSQLRRAAVSVPSNISEGAARRSSAEFRRFLHIAAGSLAELETQLIIAKKLDYVSPNDFDVLMEERSRIARLVQGLVQSLSRKIGDR